MQNKNTVRVVSFVAASSGSGKTTLIENVIPFLIRRGLRVAVIKHASAGFDLDRPGKDSQRFQEAGATSVVLVGPTNMALLKRIDHEPTSEEIDQLPLDADIIIYEGFKKTARNKIEVFRREVSGERPLCMRDQSFIALVSDSPFEVPVPRFDINDAEGVASFLVSHPLFP